MKKEDLIEYLKVVCGVEEAAYACEETIRALQERLQFEQRRVERFVKPKRPEKTEPYLTEPHQEEFKAAEHNSEPLSCLVLFLALVAGIYFAVLGWRMGLGEPSPIGSLVFSILGFFFGVFLVGFIGDFAMNRLVILPARKKVESENASRREAAERENARRIEAAEREYKSDCAKYERECAALEQEREASARVQKLLSEAIAINQATLTRIKAMLEKLYGLGVIYPTFQNMIAVHQIRQYLEMGLCDGLEGPTGAYAEYMKDVRTRQICGSIEDMRDAVLGALTMIAANQQLLYREMRQVNANIESLQGSLERGLLAIQGEFQKAREGLILAASAAHEPSATVNRQLAEMRRLLLITARNQYIIQREQLANDWWNRWRLKHPY